VVPPFPRITYTEAVAKLNGLGSDITWGQDLGGDDETLIAQDSVKPVFVMNYPKEVKAFYMKENPDDPRTILGNDCIAPEGYGEIIGGSQREDDYDKLRARIVAQGSIRSRMIYRLRVRHLRAFRLRPESSGLAGSAASHIRRRSRFARFTACTRDSPPRAIVLAACQPAPRPPGGPPPSRSPGSSSPTPLASSPAPRFPRTRVARFRRRGGGSDGITRPSGATLLGAPPGNDRPSQRRDPDRIGARGHARGPDQGCRIRVMARALYLPGLDASTGNLDHRRSRESPDWLSFHQNEKGNGPFRRGFY
jgi:hypothetical protein